MNILIKWIFKAEQVFYATTIRFFPTLTINQGLLSEWDDSRLTSELNRTTFDEEVCQELGYNRGLIHDKCLIAGGFPPDGIRPQIAA